MQKLVYVSNSRDYTEQGDINDNLYLTHINGLLEQGWRVCHLTPNAVGILNEKKPKQNETFAVYILLEKPDETE